MQKNKELNIFNREGLAMADNRRGILYSSSQVDLAKCVASYSQGNFYYFKKVQKWIAWNGLEWQEISRKVCFDLYVANLIKDIQNDLFFKSDRDKIEAILNKLNTKDRIRYFMNLLKKHLVYRNQKPHIS